VFPLLPGRQSKTSNGPLSGPFGEIVGNNYLPKAASAS
jgi:alkanesulfonate monooxygenase